MKGLTIYRSSAGSGKTYTLVREYLAVALVNPARFKNILAVTFTNKATAEMKNRIIKALVDLSSGNVTALANDLMRETGLSQQLLVERSGELLTNILHHYSHFSISTIDSFFNDIVKSLAHELKLSLHFNLELDQNLLLDHAYHQLMQHVGHDKDLTKWLLDFINYKLEEEKGWNIKEELVKLSKKLFDERFPLPEDKATVNFGELNKTLSTIKSNYEKAMAGYGQKFKSAIASAGFSADDFSYGKSGIAGYFTKIVMRLKPADYKPGTRVEDVAANEDRWLSKSKKADSALAGLVADKLHPLLIETINFHNQHFSLYISAAEALKMLFVNGILSRMNEELKIYRDENETITLSDVNRIVRQAVSMNDTPFVFEKTGHFYQHYMLDEFQDTSTVQWNNIKPLLMEAISNEKSALIVGDVKQSIYRWRGGNMNLLQEQIEHDFHPITKEINKMSLGVNYRSAKPIITFNNLFFENAAQIISTYNDVEIPVLKSSYAANQLHQQIPDNVSEHGYVKINFITADKNAKQNDDEHWQQQSLKLLLLHINELLALGYTHKDLAILVRNGNDGRRVADYLFSNGILKIISSESLNLNKSQQVNFVINCLRILAHPNDKFVFKELETFIYHYRNLKNVSFRFIESSSEEISLFQKKFSAQLNKPVDELVSLLIHYFKLNALPDIYIQRLQDVLLEYLGKNTPDIPSFLKWWDEKSDSFSLIMPENFDAISIITIHKAKGLQFPIVLMPFAEWELKPHKNSIIWASSTIAPFHELKSWPLDSSSILAESVFKEAYRESVEENFIDNLNLLYVAFTRAESQLYITCPINKESKNKKVSSLVFETLNSCSAFSNLLNQSGNHEFEYGVKSDGVTKASSFIPYSFYNPEPLTLQQYLINTEPFKLKIDQRDFTSAQIEHGLIIHKVLSLMCNENDLQKAMTYAKNIYNLIPTDLNLIKAELVGVLKACAEKKWFKNHYLVKNETEIKAPDGSICRPDRLMFTGNKAIVVDYKTGEEKSIYEKQAESYGKLLKDAGYTEVECWLLYTHNKQLVQVR